MPNTYTQLYVQAVFTVKNRQSLIIPLWRDELYKYITGIVQNNGHKLIAINGMPDHLHLLIGLKPNQSLSDLMQDVKGDSSKWINNKGFIKSQFEWQAGFGAFSYSITQIDAVVKYINNQEEHHKKESFRNTLIFSINLMCLMTKGIFLNPLNNILSLKGQLFC